MPDLSEVMSAPLEVNTDNQNSAAGVAGPRSTVFRNLFRDTVWQVIGSVFASGMMLFMNLAAVRMLGRSEFGAFGLVQTAALWCLTVFAFGTVTSVMIQTGKLRGENKGQVLGASLIYLTVVVVSTSFLVWIYPPGPGSLIMPELTPDAGPLVILYTGLLFFFLLWSGILRGADRFQFANALVAIQTTALTLGVLVGILVWGGHGGALWGAGVTLSAVVIIIIALSIKSWGIALPSWQSFLSIGGSVGVRSYIVTVSEVFAETFGILYLSYQHDLLGVAAVVGSQRISTILSKPSEMLQAVLMGKIAGQVSGELEAQKVLQVARFSFLGSLALSIPLLLFVRQFTILTLGESFSDAVMVMAFFLLSAVFRGHAVTAAGFLVGQGCQRPYVILKIGVLIATVIGVLILGPTMGAVAVALVQCIMSFVMMVVIAGDVAIQAKSFKSVFTGNDLVVLTQLLSLKNQLLSYIGR